MDFKEVQKVYEIIAKQMSHGVKFTDVPVYEPRIYKIKNGLDKNGVYYYYLEWE